LPPDASFHGNLDKVESWIQLLGKDASKKEDTLFRGVSPILSLINRMLNPEPTFRPQAKDVESRLLDILLKVCRIESPNIHCGVGGVHMGQSKSGGNWDFGFQDLNLNGLTSPTRSSTFASPSSTHPTTSGSFSASTEPRKARQGSSDREYVSAAATGSNSYGGSFKRYSGMADGGDSRSIMTKGSASGSKSSDGEDGFDGE